MILLYLFIIRLLKIWKDALRVLALAYRKHDGLPGDISSNNIENEMIFVGLVGMIDPARPEAKDAILKCKEAGIEMPEYEKKVATNFIR